MLWAGSLSRKRMARSGPTRSVPCVASHRYSSSVRPSSWATVRSAATISGMGVDSAGGAGYYRLICLDELLLGKQTFVTVQGGHLGELLLGPDRGFVSIDLRLHCYRSSV